jgi:hypothetical protein
VPHGAIGEVLGGVTREGKGQAWAGGLGWPEGIVFFSIYSKTFQTELNRFAPKKVFPYSENSK